MNGKRYGYEAAYKNVRDRTEKCPDCGAATEAYLPESPEQAAYVNTTFDCCPCGWESGERDFTYAEYMFVEDLRFDDASGDVDGYYEFFEKETA